MSKTIAETLADFIHDATYENLPKEVIHQAKRCLMDTCGAIIAGSFHSKSGKGRAKLRKDSGRATNRNHNRDHPNAVSSNGCLCKWHRSTRP